MDVREHILTEATQRFAAQGFGSTSLAEISNAVGIRKPSLLYHFNSKEALREAVLLQMLTHFNEILPRVLVAAAKKDRFDGVMNELLDFFDDDPNRARLLLREILDRPETMTTLMLGHVRPWIKVVAEQIQQAKDDGHAHIEVDPEAYAVQMIHLVISTVAILDSLTTLLPGRSRKQLRARQRDELLRIAKTSLFANPPR